MKNQTKKSLIAGSILSGVLATSTPLKADDIISNSSEFENETEAGSVVISQLSKINTFELKCGEDDKGGDDKDKKPKSKLQNKVENEVEDEASREANRQTNNAKRKAKRKGWGLFRRKINR